MIDVVRFTGRPTVNGEDTPDQYYTLYRYFTLYSDLIHDSMKLITDYGTVFSVRAPFYCTLY